MDFSGGFDMEVSLTSIIASLVLLIVSTIIIYVGAKLLGEKEKIGTAFACAILGAILYFIVGSVLSGLVGSIVAFIGWLATLRYLYKTSWIKALVLAIVIWVIAAIVGLVLPTLTGPF